MTLLLAAVGIIIVGAIGALLASRLSRVATGIASVTSVAGSLLGLAPALRVLLGGAAESMRLVWEVPYGAFYVELDALSAFFLVPIFILGALSAVYGAQYLQAYRSRKSLGPPWFFFNLLLASMVLVAVARNGVLFLVAWEVMSLGSFFLVTFEDEHPRVREAGWTYLVATHLGTVFLLVLFVLLGREAGSLDFDKLGGAAHFPPETASLLFVLALIGFGTKAGFMPLHVWLPEAHPAAPSHVSALMSGVMIKTGIYGLLRTVTWLGPPPAWWGWLMIGIGLSSGILGVLFALAQHDLKRLLAYHSVENIGIVMMGLGAGFLGVSAGSPVLAVLGFAGGLLHVINHAFFKGLLFLGAGAVFHGTGSREIDHLGGLLKRMPWTGATFLVGAAAISGLPPLNGFVSEFLIYLGGFRAVAMHSVSLAVAGLVVIAGLALIGGLAAACFTKAFGIVFLGEPRSEHAAHAHESGPAMLLPMALLAAACVLIGLFAPVVVGAMVSVIEPLTGLHPAVIHEHLALAAGPLWFIGAAAFGLIALIAGLAALRRRLLAGRVLGETGTWDCGYAQPTARMQYTASSFAQPLIELFRSVLRSREKRMPPAGLFPREASLATETADVFTENLYRPAFGGIAWGLGRLRWLQHGRVQLYVLYIALTLLILLVWRLD